jgi:hypothetical protein
MKTTIELAREVDPVTKLLLDKKLPQGMDHDAFMWFLERFAELVRADEREQGQKWFDAVTAQHKQLILAEREACAKVCDEQANELYESRAHHKCAEYLAEQIRARSNP